MKKLLILLLSIAALSFSSCTKNKKENCVKNPKDFYIEYTDVLPYIASIDTFKITNKEDIIYNKFYIMDNKNCVHEIIVEPQRKPRALGIIILVCLIYIVGIGIGYSLKGNDYDSF